MTTVSVILPTYNEAETITGIIDFTRGYLREHDYDTEILVVDDDSPDGTSQLVETEYRADPEVNVLTRTEESGLSSAILTGLEYALGDVLVVMDADGQHPPRIAPRLADAITSGADIAVGSRHAAGGENNAEWGLKRHATSRIATGLAHATIPSARTLQDPMSGCFAIHARHHDIIAELDPHGYKILLELIARTPDPAIEEVGMEFRPRAGGESNLDSSEVGRYLEHLASLGLHRTGLDDYLTPPVAIRAVEAGLVSAIAMVVIFYAMLFQGAIGFALTAAAGGAITLSLTRVWHTHETWTSNPPTSCIEELGGSQQ